MQIQTIITDLIDAGIVLSFEHDRLICKAPKGTLTKERQLIIKENKQDIINFLISIGHTENSSTVQSSRQTENIPLSFAQEQIWLSEQVYGQNSAYNMPSALMYRGETNFSALRFSLQQLVNTHDAFRSFFLVSSDEGGLQSVKPYCLLNVPLVDLEALSVEDLDYKNENSELFRLLEGESTQIFDLEEPPLLRASLFKISGTEHVFLYTMHHVISDGWSLRIFESELMKGVRAYEYGKDANVGVSEIRYADFAIWQRKWLSGKILEEHKQYWAGQIESLPDSLNLPLKKPKEKIQSSSGRVWRDSISFDSLKRYQEIIRNEGVTLFSLLLSAYKLVLSRYGQINDIPIGIVSSGRENPQLHNIIGCFVNTVLVRSHVDRKMTLADFLRQVQSSVLKGQQYQQLPLELVDQNYKNTGMRSSKWFESLFILQADSESDNEFGSDQNASLDIININRNQAKFDISVSVTERKTALYLTVEYLGEFYSEELIKSLFAYFKLVLAYICDNPSSTISCLPPILPTEADTVNALPALKESTPLLIKFLNICKQCESNIALQWVSSNKEVEKLSYADLLKKIDRAACALQKKNIKAGDRVGVCMKRGPGVVISLFAIWRLRAVYVPLDPDYPETRLKYIVNNAKIKSIITDDRLVDGLPKFAEQMSLNTLLAGTTVNHQLPIPNIFDSAYVIYTSGSTGEPKGVEVSHQAIASFVNAVIKSYGWRMDDTILQFASISFDTAFEEILPALCCGASLVFRSEEALDYKAFIDYIELFKISILDLPTAYWHQLVNVLDSSELITPTTLRQVIIGGERVDLLKVKQWMALNIKDVDLINSYGPTEATVVASYTVLNESHTGSREVSIGTALPNAELYVLDEHMNMVPIDVVGELYIGGASIANGYVGRAGETASRFIPSPFARNPGARLYRSGDLVCWRHSGELEYVGRQDYQVKLRGYRIETSEISKCIQKVEGVKDAIVHLISHDLNDQRLIAYIVPDWAHEIRSNMNELLDSNVSVQCQSFGVSEYVGRNFKRRLLPYQLAESVEKYSARIALRLEQENDTGFSSKEVNYQEFYKNIASLCIALQEKGVCPGDRVGILMQRGEPLVTSLFALWKLGAVYVPLDPSLPVSRLKYMVDDAGIKHILKNENEAYEFDGTVYLEYQNLLRLDSNFNDVIKTPVLSPITDDWPAYIIYTSGSTGKPKGVVISHFAITSFIDAAKKSYGWHAQDVVMQFSATGFDVSLQEILLTLMVGAQLVFKDEHSASDIRCFINQSKKLSVSIWSLPTAYWHQLNLHLDYIDSLPDTLRQVIILGERVDPIQVRAWNKSPLTKSTVLINGYGPTEASVVASTAVLDNNCFGIPDNHKSYIGEAPIGHALNNTLLYVLDDQMQRIEIGEIGELYIGGDGLSSGYVNRPGHTGERFLPNPYVDKPGARLYRSGDRVRWRKDGQLEYIGRVDQQIKIRGYRIEPGEIEGCISQHQGINTVVVTAVKVKNDHRLVAYVVAAEDITEEQLETYCRSELPNYMVPTRFILMDTMPLNTNGKINRQALPKPVWNIQSNNFAKPETEAEISLSRLWSEVLATEKIGLDDNFFALGGHSLLAMQLINLIYKHFGVVLSLHDFFACPTVREQVGFCMVNHDSKSSVIVPIKENDVYPLSNDQQRLWFSYCMDPRSSVYNLSYALCLSGGFDIKALSYAATIIVNRHDVLRTRYFQSEDEGFQRIDPPLDKSVTLIEVNTNFDKAAFLKQWANQPFKLDAGDVIRFALLRCYDSEDVLLLNIHHIVTDGWSMQLLLDELTSIYNEFLLYKKKSKLPLPVQYGDYAAWQRNNSVSSSSFQYWTNQLEGMPAYINLPLDYPRPETAENSGQLIKHRIDRSVSGKLKKLVQASGCSLFSGLLSVFHLLLSRYTGNCDTVVGTAVANRNQPELESLIGFFVNTLVLRNKVDESLSFDEWLILVKNNVHNAIRYGDVPFEYIVKSLNPERNTSYNPLVQVMFTMELDVSETAKPVFNGTTATFDTQAKTNLSVFDMSWHVTDKQDSLDILVTYNTSIFKAKSIEQMIQAYAYLLEQVVEFSGRPLNMHKLQHQEIGKRWLNEYATGFDKDYPETDIVALFEARVSTEPDRLAILDAHRQLTFSEFDRLVNRMANALLAEGVKPGMHIGICLPRRIEYIAAIWASLKLGVAYVPIDPDYPQARLEYICHDADLAVLLAWQGLCDLDEVGVKTLDVQSLLNNDAHFDSPYVSFSGLQTAYIIYTSGSTGQPKGVSVPRLALLHLMHALSGTVYADNVSRDRFSVNGSFAFDTSVKQYLQLCQGACILLLDEETRRSPESLIHYVAKNKVDVLDCTPSQAILLLEACQRLQLKLPKRVLIGGEAIDSSLWKKLNHYSQIYGSDFYNVYGPTECTVDSTYTLISACSQPRLGMPLPNVQVYILNQALEVVPPGVVGELYIGGSGVALGYYRRASLTAERFIPDPFSNRVGQRLYKTGDSVRWHADGSLEYMGRIDKQVKIRGYRVEPGEIEQCIHKLESVSQVAVKAVEVNGDTRLVAYAVPESEQNIDLSEVVISHSRRYLPSYMLPAKVMTLRGFPLTKHGKIDYPSLPVPDWSGTGEYVAPVNHVQEKLAAVWSEVLGIDRVGIHDNFFILGGHSLLVMKLLSRIRSIWTSDLTIKDLFICNTIYEQARWLDDHEANTTSNYNLGGIPVHNKKTGPLSPVQHRLWLVEQMNPDNAAYVMSDAVRFSGALNIQALNLSIHTIAWRHSILRSNIRMNDGMPEQFINDVALQNFLLIDLCNITDDLTVASALKYWSKRVFDLETDPLFRAALLRISEKEYILLISLHHIVSDGWSMQLLHMELGQLYYAYVNRKTNPLPPLEVQYLDYAYWQQEQLGDIELTKQLNFWESQLKDALPLLALPTDRPRPEYRSYNGGQVLFRVENQVSDIIRDIVKTENVTPFMFFISVYIIFLQRLSEQPDIIIGVPIANRPDPSLESLIGFFTNTIVIRHKVDQLKTILDLLSDVKTLTLDAQEYLDVPFERVVEHLNPLRSLQYSPVFQVAFNYLSSQGEGDVASLPGLNIERVRTGAGQVSLFDLTLFVREVDECWHLGLEYNSDIYDHDTVHKFSKLYLSILKDCIGNLGKPLYQLPNSDFSFVSGYKGWCALISHEKLALMVKTHLNMSLPDYMQPSDIAVINRLPVSVNGKVDLAGLPRPDVRKSHQESYVAPRDEVEQSLSNLWCDVLLVDRVGVYDNFFELGGHSLSAIRLNARIRETLNVDIKVYDIFTKPTVIELADFIKLSLATQPLQAVSDELEDITSLNRSRYPLSYAQKRLWFIDQVNPYSVLYNIPVLIEFGDIPSLSALHVSIINVIARHSVLRTTFGQESDTAYQVLNEIPSSGLLVIDTLFGAGREIIKQWLNKPFSLITGDVFRAALVREDNGACYFLLNIHHIVSDGWSMQILMYEIGAVYNAYLHRETPELPLLNIQYGDYAQWQSDTFNRSTQTKQLDYWLAYLSELPDQIGLPFDYPRPAVQTYAGSNYRFTLELELTDRLRSISLSHNTTLFTTLLALFKLLLSHMSNTNDITVGTPVLGRSQRMVEPLIGFFVNTLVLRTKIDHNKNFDDYLSDMRSNVLNAFEHSDIQFEKLVEELNPNRDPRKNPLFQILFSFDKALASDERINFGGIDAQYIKDTSEVVAKFDLSMDLVEENETIRGNLNYNTALFKRETIAQMVESFQLIISSVCEQPHLKLHQINCMPKDVFLQLSVLQTKRYTADVVDIPIPLQMSKQFKAWEDSTALYWINSESETEVLSYAALLKDVQTISGRLASLGIGENDTVAVYMPQGGELVVSLFALWQLGAVYVPLDMKLPVARLRYIIEDAGVDYLIYLSAACPVSSSVSQYDYSVLLSQPKLDYELCPISVNHTAYMIYTSGSTGQPKGVMISHGAIASFVRAGQAYYGWNQSDSVLQFASIGFDVSMQEILLSLLSGSCLVFRDEGIINSAKEFIAFTERFRISIWSLPTAYWHQLNTQLSTYDALPPCLRQVVIAGERADPTHVHAWFNQVATCGIEMINGYGPTEATIIASAKTLKAWEWPTSRIAEVPIGEPLGNNCLYVLDQYLNPVPFGVKGELYIGGQAVATGYAKRPNQTALNFLPDPYCSLPGKRMYKSGDQVRWTASGELEFLGRVDNQIKVRGYRIEPGEIETCIAQVDSVENVLVIPIVITGDTRLVAYVSVGERHKDESIIDKITGHCREQLPAYMLPAKFILLQAMPLNSNGKINRKALPTVDWESTEIYVPPRNEKEDILVNIWIEVLNVEQVGIEDNFFMLGGHSLLAIQLLSRIKERFNQSLNLLTLFNQPTIKGLSEFIEINNDEGIQLRKLSPLKKQRYPLSYPQQRLWFIEQMGVVKALYNVPVSFALKGNLNIRAIKKALLDLIRRHQILRTRFVEANDQAWQLVESMRDVPFLLVDKTLGAHDIIPELRHWFKKGFVLDQGEVFRVSLIKHKEDRHTLLLNMHHIVTDAWSIQIFLYELAHYYNQYIGNQFSELPTVNIQYGDYAQWQRDCFQDEIKSSLTAYWSEKLANIPEQLPLPTDYARPVMQSHKGENKSFVLNESLTNRLKSLSQYYNCTMFMTLLAVFQLLLARLSGTTDIVVGTPVAGRSRKDIENIIGFFVNTLVLREQIDEQRTWSEHLNSVKTNVLNAFKHEDMPFEKLVEIINPDRNFDRNPLFQVMFSFAKAVSTDQRINFNGLEATYLNESVDNIAKFDLSINLNEAEDVIHGNINYNVALFKADSIGQIVKLYVYLLEQVVEHRDCPLSSLRLQSKTAEQTWLGRHAQGVDFPYAESDIVTLFEERVSKEPGRLAIMDAHRQITFSEMDIEINRLANTLYAQGIKPGMRIGICLSRRIEYITAIWAALKLGACYVPLDPEYPQARLEYIYKDADLALLLVEGVSSNTHGDDIVVFDVQSLVASDSDSVSPYIRVPSQQAAYLIYTSGSSGQPKGVSVARSSLLHLMHALSQTIYDDKAYRGRLAINGSFAFDTSVKQYVQLCQGACLLILPEDIRRSPELLIGYVSKHKVTVLDSTPSQLIHLLEASKRVSIKLPDRILVGGEAINSYLWQSLQAYTNTYKTRFYNVYGPTECTVDSTYADIQVYQQPTLGLPLPNVQVYVLDELLRAVPAGIVGELYIGGFGVATSYHRRAALTADRFIPDPFTKLPGQRLYRSGDLGRWRMDGRLDFIGRSDEQVKIRGYRIEPGEIERCINENEFVHSAAVQAITFNNDIRLVAYIVAHNTSGIDLMDIVDSHCKYYLPSHMVPSKILIIEKLPLTSHGKLDYSSLPMPDWSSGDQYVSPRNNIEREIANIWSQVLNVDRVGIYDNFFKLGGHSLLAIQLLNRIRDTFNYAPELLVLFNSPTVAGQAKAMREAKGMDTYKAQIPLIPMNKACYPLSYAQQRLWFIEQINPGSVVYNIPKMIGFSEMPNLSGLYASIANLINRHSVLHSTFLQKEDMVYQAVNEEKVLPILLIDAHAGEYTRIIKQWLNKPFSLSQGDVFRVALLRTKNGKYYFLLNIHHIISDGWSMQILMYEISEVYNAFCQKRNVKLPSLDIQYGDYAQWQAEALSGEAQLKQLDYWVNYLNDIPNQIGLPFDYQRPPVQTYRGNNYPFILTEDSVKRLRDISLRHNTTLFTALLAVFKLLLSHSSNNNDIVVGTPISGRTQRAVENLIGFFVNTLVLRTKIDRSNDFETYLESVRTNVLNAFEHSDIQFETLVEELNPERDPGKNPLFQVLFSFDKELSNDEIISFDGIDAWPIRELSSAVAKFDLFLSLKEGADTVRGNVNYNEALFTHETIVNLCNTFQKILSSVTEAPEKPLYQVDYLSSDALRRLQGYQTNDFNSLTLDKPIPAGLENLFDSYGMATALCWITAEGRTESISYSDLLNRVCILTEHFSILGIGEASYVGVYMPRGHELIISLFALWQLGAVYVPLDMQLPESRLAHIIDDAGIECIVYADSRCPIHSSVSQHAYSELMNQPGSLCKRDIFNVTTNHIAYMIYTSGSTGQPKGVMINHGSIMSFVQAAQCYYRWSNKDSVLQFAAIGFDVSIQEMLLTLLSGATLVIRNEYIINNVDDFLEFTKRFNISVWSLPTAYWHQLNMQLTADKALPVSLRQVVIAGERADPGHVRSWFNRSSTSSINLINGYGPTEATIIASAAALSSQMCSDSFMGEVSIGRPLSNSCLYVLDPYLNPVPVGVKGELYIGGHGIANGYANRPGQTSVCFIPDPYCKPAGKRMYKTGDWVRWNKNEELEFLGRVDNQVKIRGYRIEPGEIEACLNSHDNVSVSAVEAVSVNNDIKLVAYVAVKNTALSTSMQLEQYCGKYLPSYMIPAKIIILSELPVNANGKVNRGELPVPEWRLEDRYCEPRNDYEKRMADIWADILGMDKVGIDDNFFSLGGHSLLMIRLLNALNNALESHYTISDIYLAPTIREITARKKASFDAPEDLVELREGSGLVGAPCIVLIHPIGGSIDCYRTLSTKLPENFRVIALQAPYLVSGKNIPDSIDEYAKEYLNTLVKENVGKIILGGWSLGGVIAQQMTVLAECNKSLNIEVESLLMIDSYSDNNRDKKSDSLRCTDKEALFILCRDIGLLKVASEKKINTIKDFLFYAKKHNLLSQDVSELDIERRLNLIAAHETMSRSHRPKNSNIPTVYIRPESNKKGWKVWSRINKNIEIVDFEGDHYTLLKSPSVDRIAELIVNKEKKHNE